MVIDEFDAASLAELNGVTYLAASVPGATADDVRLYRVAQDSTNPVLVRRLRPGQPSQMLSWDNKLFLLQKPVDISGDRDNQAGVFLYRYDPSTHRLARVADLSSSADNSRIVSMTEFNDQIYYFVDHRSSNETPIKWEIWRSAGEPGDSIRVHAESLTSRRNQARFVASYSGHLKTTDSAIWFMAANQVSGTELWQLKAN